MIGIFLLFSYFDLGWYEHYYERIPVPPSKLVFIDAKAGQINEIYDIFHICPEKKFNRKKQVN